MPDTIRTRAQLVALLPDNTTRQITAQTLRDWLLSSYLKADVDGLLTAKQAKLSGTNSNLLIFNDLGDPVDSGQSIQEFALTGPVSAHINATNNPHSTTAAQVGALPTTGGTMSGTITINGGLGTTTLEGAVIQTGTVYADAIHPAVESFVSIQAHLLASGFVQATSDVRSPLILTDQITTQAEAALTITGRPGQDGLVYGLDLILTGGNGADDPGNDSGGNAGSLILRAGQGGVGAIGSGTSGVVKVEGAFAVNAIADAELAIRRAALSTLDHAANAYVHPPFQSTTTAAAAAVNTAYAWPVFLRKGRTYDRIGVFVAASANSGSFRLGLYSIGSNGRPGTVLLDAGTVSHTTASNARYDATISYSPTVDGWVYVVVATSAVVSQMSGGAWPAHLVTGTVTSAPGTGLTFTRNPATAFAANPTCSVATAAMPAPSLRISAF